MTLTATAARAGMSPAALSRIETGQVSPTLPTIERMARAIGVEVYELFIRPAPESAWGVATVAA
jgi:transcriptional regulator with XRE-family HTH domain